MTVAPHAMMEDLTGKNSMDFGTWQGAFRVGSQMVVGTLSAMLVTIAQYRLVIRRTANSTEICISET